jgi:hypothetical protein
MHPVLAGFLLAWRERTLYAKDKDYVFPSFRLKGGKPLSASIMVGRYLHPLPLKPVSSSKISKSASGFKDGIAGICDDKQHLCFALALWNGMDPILKERLFGLTNSEGNHGGT